MSRKQIECEIFAEYIVYPICNELNLLCKKPFRLHCMTINFLENNKILSISVPCDINRRYNYSNFIIETNIIYKSNNLDNDNVCRYSLTEFQKYLIDNIELFVKN